MFSLVLSAAVLVLVLVIENAAPSDKARVMRTAGRPRVPRPPWSSALLARKPAFDYEYRFAEHEHEKWTSRPS